MCTVFSDPNSIEFSGKALNDMTVLMKTVVKKIGGVETLIATVISPNQDIQKGLLSEVKEGIKDSNKKLNKLLELFQDIEKLVKHIIEKQDAAIIMKYIEIEKKNPTKIIEKVFKNMKDFKWDKEKVKEFLGKLVLALKTSLKLKQAFKPTWKEKFLAIIKGIVNFYFGTVKKSIAGKIIKEPIDNIYDNFVGILNEIPE